MNHDRRLRRLLGWPLDPGCGRCRQVAPRQPCGRWRYHCVLAVVAEAIAIDIWLNDCGEVDFISGAAIAAIEVSRYGTALRDGEHIAHCPGRR
jgi:hypothetical protein